MPIRCMAAVLADGRAGVKKLDGTALSTPKGTVTTAALAVNTRDPT